VKTGPGRNSKRAWRWSNTSSGDVGRQQIRRALKALEGQAERLREEPRDQGLGEPRIVLDQDVAVRQNPGQDALEHVALADDHARQRLRMSRLRSVTRSSFTGASPSEAMSRASVAMDGPRPNRRPGGFSSASRRDAGRARERDEPRPQQVLEIGLAPRAGFDLVVEPGEARILSARLRPASPGSPAPHAARRSVTRERSPHGRDRHEQDERREEPHRGLPIGLRDEEFGQRDRGDERGNDHERGDDARAPARLRRRQAAPPRARARI